MRANACGSISEARRSIRPPSRTTSIRDAGNGGRDETGADLERTSFAAACGAGTCAAVNATGTNTCDVALTAAAASFRQRYSKLWATPLLRATAEMFTPGTDASSTVRCFSAAVQIRRAATTVKSREDISPDLGTCLSPTMTNEVIIRPICTTPQGGPGRVLTTRTTLRGCNVRKRSSLPHRSEEYA